MFFRKKKLNAEELELRTRQVDYKAHVADLRWKQIKYGIPLLIILAIVGMSVYNNVTEKPVVPVVRLQGTVASNATGGSADQVVKDLRTAFGVKGSKAVVLLINSPGGAPAEAERITAYIDAQKSKTGKEVYAICTDMCASAAYMVAAHADKIYAGSYSLVGSIGAIMRSWNFSELIGKVGVANNSYSSGALKNMLDPYVPVRAEDAEKAQELVNGMGRTFADEIRTLRGPKLKDKGGTDLFSGAVWTGSQARDLGLIDAIGTLEQVAVEHFPDDARMWDITKSGSKFGLLRSATDVAVSAAVDALRQAGAAMEWR